MSDCCGGCQLLPWPRFCESIGHQMCNRTLRPRQPCRMKPTNERTLHVSSCRTAQEYYWGLHVNGEQLCMHLLCWRPVSRLCMCVAVSSACWPVQVHAAFKRRMLHGMHLINTSYALDCAGLLLPVLPVEWLQVVCWFDSWPHVLANMLGSTA